MAAPNLAGQLDPGALSQYLGYTVHPELSQATTGITLSNTLHNLGLVRVSPATITGTDPMFGETFSTTSPCTKVAVNVQGAPLGATHQWFALFDMGGHCVATTADGLAVQWGTGYQTFSWVTPVSLVAGGLYFIDAVNNGSTAAKLSGVVTLAAEVNGALAANGTTPYRWATNSGSLGTAPPVVGTSTLAYASNSAVTTGFWAGLL